MKSDHAKQLKAFSRTMAGATAIMCGASLQYGKGAVALLSLPLCVIATMTYFALLRVAQSAANKAAQRSTPFHGPNGGVAGSPDDAKATFRAAGSVRYRRKRT
jgi:hypothetical protein